MTSWARRNSYTHFTVPEIKAGREFIIIKITKLINGNSAKTKSL